MINILIKLQELAAYLSTVFIVKNPSLQARMAAILKYGHHLGFIEYPR